MDGASSRERQFGLGSASCRSSIGVFVVIMILLRFRLMIQDISFGLLLDASDKGYLHYVWETYRHINPAKR